MDDEMEERDKTARKQLTLEHDLKQKLKLKLKLKIEESQSCSPTEWVVDREDDDGDELSYALTWGKRKQWLAAQSRAGTGREVREERVRFAAVAVQWRERERHSQGISEKRFGKVCGKGYNGEGPKMVDEMGRNITTISDSGTNIDVMSSATAQYLHRCGLVYHKCSDTEPKRYVVFGVATAREPILGYIFGQGLMGKVAVVKGVAANLISVTAFTKRGMIVTYSETLVEIRKASNNELVFVGPFDSKTGLYHLDLIHLMMAPGTDDQGEGQTRRLIQGDSFVAGIQEECQEELEEAQDEDGNKPRTTFKQAAILRAMQFHANMEHVPFSTIADNIEAGTWSGLHPDLTPAIMRELAKRRDCVICGISRWNQDHPTGSGTRVYPVGHTVALDYQGKVSPVSRNGETGEFVLTDVGSGFTKRYGERNKKTTIVEALKEWCSLLLSYGHVVKEARHDSGAVELGAQFIIAARTLGITPIPTAPGVPEMRIERRIQTHKNDIAGILARTRLLETKDWDIASSHACLIRSTMRCAASKLQGNGDKSPYELVTGKKPRIEVFEEYGLGDIGVVKKAGAKKPGYGGHKNEAVQIVGMEVGDVKAVRVEMVGTRTRARRSGVKRLYLRSTEMSEEEQKERKATFTDNEADGSVTFAIEGGGDVIVESVQQLAAQEMDLAKKSSEEELESVARRMQLRRDQQRKDADEKEKEANNQGTTGVEKTQEQKDREEDWYFPWDEDGANNRAFWAAYLSDHRLMLTEEYANDLNAFTARTGVTFSMTRDEDESDEEETGTTGVMVCAGAEVAGSAFAARSRQVRDKTNPTQRMIKDDTVLAEMWGPSMIKERNGITATSHEVTKEYAHHFGVTRHVTARTTKRDGTLKTRFAIDGRQEIKQGKFPNKEALYSPAMDEELLRLSLQYAATLDMEIGKSDVVQCFTHNPMKTARFKRKIIVYLDEYESGAQGGQFREFDSVSYGTADASSEWYINMSTELMSHKKGMGFSKSVYHPCLFYKGSVASEDLVTVSVATDDMLRLNLKSDKSRLAMINFKTALDKKWPVTHEDDDTLKEILGVAVVRGHDGSIRCTQPSEMRKIREAFFDDKEVPEVMVPLHPEVETGGHETGGIFDGDNDSEEARAERASMYRSMLGKLGYIRITRLDVLHTLSVLAERAHRPARRDVHALYWLAAYLLTTELVPLTFHRGDTDEAMNEEGVFRWTLFGDCSWASRAGSASCIAQMVVHGNLKTAEQLERKPFTAPVVAKTGKQKGPAADSASAGEMMATVAVIKSGMAIRGMSEELAGVAEPQPSTERMPAGGAGASPLCTDNASNGITIASMTGKKAKGMRLMAREIAFVQYFEKEGAVEVVTVTGKQQRANPLTKAIRSASVHFREAEWLLGTSQELEKMQNMAEERGRSKRSLRPEVISVAGFAGLGVLGNTGDKEWAESATDLRDTGKRSNKEEHAVTQRNTKANGAPSDGTSFRLWALLKDRRPALQDAKQRNADNRWAENPNHNRATKFDTNCHTADGLAKLIFRTEEWMAGAEWDPVSEPPSDDDAAEQRHTQEDKSRKAQSDAGESGPMEETVEEVKKKRHGSAGQQISRKGEARRKGQRERSSQRERKRTNNNIYV